MAGSSWLETKTITPTARKAEYATCRFSASYSLATPTTSSPTPGKSSQAKEADTANDDDVARIEHGGPKTTEQGGAASVFGSVLVQNHQSGSLDWGHEDSAFPLGCRCFG